MSQRSDFALLLEEVCGRKYLTNCQLSNRTKYDPKIVKKGTLLKAITLEECTDLTKQLGFTCNYKVLDDESIKLNCNIVQIRYLTYYQMELLKAVEYLEDRSEVTHKLEWAEKLREGVGIHVIIPTYPYPVKGIIQHCGKLPDRDGIRFKVELIVS